jgi:hypothetical protein
MARGSNRGEALECTVHPDVDSGEEAIFFSCIQRVFYKLSDGGEGGLARVVEACKGVSTHGCRREVQQERWLVSHRRKASIFATAKMVAGAMAAV